MTCTPKHDPVTPPVLFLPSVCGPGPRSFGTQGPIQSTSPDLDRTERRRPRVRLFPPGTRGYATSPSPPRETVVHPRQTDVSSQGHLHHLDGHPPVPPLLPSVRVSGPFRVPQPTSNKTRRDGGLTAEGDDQKGDLLAKLVFVLVSRSSSNLLV